MIKIEKNIPVPEDNIGTRGCNITLLNSMEEGDSIVVDLSKKTNLWQTARRHGAKLTARKLDDTGLKYRVWLVSKGVK